MESLISADGTRIAYKRSGNGPPLVLVHGATSNHTRWAGILPELEDEFTVFAMERRGRGESGDAATYSIDREYEDVVAVPARTGASDERVEPGAFARFSVALR